MGWSGRGAVALAVGIVCGLAMPAGGSAAPVVSDRVPSDPWSVVRPRFEPVDGSSLRVEATGDYRGAVEVTRAAASNGLAIVNDVQLDDYLRGISEVPNNWPLEAQKAQAVAARTYALYEAGRRTNSPYKQAGADICATDACQVYTGLAKERRQGSEVWNAAVVQTRNQVLMYKNAPIVAKYSSSNGGESVGGGQPYLRPTPDPDDARSPLHQWRASYPIADLARVAGLAAEPVALHRQNEEIVATYVDPDGNPVEQRLAVDDFRSRVINGFPAPAGLPQPVPSRRFDIQAVDGMVHLDGRGWGHGIGLSQYGALGKALRGMKAPDILAAYYAGLRPVNVPADRLPQRVKVALALDRPEVIVTNATGRFRVVDATGRVLAHSATGTWKASPGAGGRVRLTPPPGQADPPSASIATVSPERPRAGKPLTVTVSLAGPAALTTIGLVRPDGTAQVIDEAKLRQPGPVVVRLGHARAGTYRLDLHQDAGNERLASSGLTVDVPPAAPGSQPEAGSDDDASLGVVGGEPAPPAQLVPTRILQATAGLMLLAVLALGALRVGRRPGTQLH